mmetsp:Transcript_21690/g.33951  ORF Transcript_21690/g.33951 Transcript_21690/m.33951 type:complete len:100 (+) Transcript_21690:752-1051(+)
MASSGEVGVFAFEVHGKVQGVFFRKYTEKKASELGLRGWVQNTPRNTVIGEVEGNPKALAKMEEWLGKTGSPKSRIDRLSVSNRRSTASSSFSKFEIRK